MNKISFEEWKNNMSFLIDDEFDNRFLKSIDAITKLINQSCTNFSNSKVLINFLTKEGDGFSSLVKLSAFVSLIGLSEERLKRVTSLVRYKFFNEEFKTEWDLKRISKTIINNESFRNLLIDFFINGRQSAAGKYIPLYYLKNFRLSQLDFINDLKSYNYVERILNDNEIQGTYSNAVGANVELIIQKKLEEYEVNNNVGLTFDTQKEFALLNKNIDFLIPNVSKPSILIECSYNITTGSGQSKRADQLVSFYSSLMSHNANHRANKIIMVNYCDGFGWVGRQNDLYRIYDASNYVVNQFYIDKLDSILDSIYRK